MKYVVVKKYSNEEKRLFPLHDSSLVSVNYESEWFEDPEGFAIGFYYNEWYVDDESCLDIFEYVDFKVLSTDSDFYGTGYDRVKCLINDEEYCLTSSRHQGETAYYSFLIYDEEGNAIYQI